jgi:hypothetical protein
LLVNYEILRPRRSLRMTGEGNFPEVSRHIIFLFFAIFKKMDSGNPPTKAASAIEIISTTYWYF